MCIVEKCPYRSIPTAIRDSLSGYEIRVVKQLLLNKKQQNTNINNKILF